MRHTYVRSFPRASAYSACGDDTATTGNRRIQRSKRRAVKRDGVRFEGAVDVCIAADVERGRSEYTIRSQRTVELSYASSRDRCARAAVATAECSPGGADKAG